MALEQRRQVVASACNLVARDMHLLESSIRSLFDAVARQASLSPEHLEEASCLANDADDRYFALLADGAPEAEWFAKARLLTAIHDGFGGLTLDAGADAIYELGAATSDPQELILSVKSRIEATTGA